MADLPKFGATRHEWAVIQQIALRARPLFEQQNIFRDLVDIEMDLDAVHSNGCPLRLSGLLAAPDFDFKHDLFGIYEYLDRSTGQLTECFSPRYSESRP